MPRIGRKNLKTCYFHVIVQGINKEYIFDKEKYMKKYQSLMLLKSKKFKFKLLAYCIMSNHTHMLMYVENIDEMSKYMQGLNTAFSKYYNMQKNRVGVVFNNRYKTEPIYDNRHLQNCIVYIHNNPVKAKMVLHPNQYQYSSYNNYITGKIDEETIKLIFGGNSQYLNDFKAMHKKENPYTFEDYIKDVDYSQRINELLTQNIGEIVMNEELLKDVIENLVIYNKIPIKKVCEIFKLTRYKISKILGK